MGWTTLSSSTMIRMVVGGGWWETQERRRLRRDEERRWVAAPRDTRQEIRGETQPAQAESHFPSTSHPIGVFSFLLPIGDHVARASPFLNSSRS